MILRDSHNNPEQVNKLVKRALASPHKGVTEALRITLKYLDTGAPLVPYHRLALLMFHRGDKKLLDILGRAVTNRKRPVEIYEDPSFVASVYPTKLFKFVRTLHFHGLLPMQALFERTLLDAVSHRNCFNLRVLSAILPSLPYTLSDNLLTQAITALELNDAQAAHEYTLHYLCSRNAGDPPLELRFALLRSLAYVQDLRRFFSLLETYLGNYPRTDYVEYSELVKLISNTRNQVFLRCLYLHYQKSDLLQHEIVMNAFIRGFGVLGEVTMLDVVIRGSNIRPGDENALRLMYRSSVRLGDESSAFHTYDRLVHQMDPTYINEWNNLFYYYLNRNRFEEMYELASKYPGELETMDVPYFLRRARFVGVESVLTVMEILTPVHLPTDKDLSLLVMMCYKNLIEKNRERPVLYRNNGTLPELTGDYAASLMGSVYRLLLLSATVDVFVIKHYVQACLSWGDVSSALNYVRKDGGGKIAQYSLGIVLKHYLTQKSENELRSFMLQLRDANALPNMNTLVSMLPGDPPLAPRILLRLIFSIEEVGIRWVSGTYWLLIPSLQLTD